MKEITAIIRPNKVSATKRALEKIGFPGMNAMRVLGKGKQSHYANEINLAIDPQILEKKPGVGMKYIPKRLLSMVVDDKEVDLVVKAIVEANQTGQIGDGRIFVESIDQAIRLSTGEKGALALK